MQQFTSTWVVVADAQRARVLYLERRGAPVRRVFEDEDGPARRFAVADVVNEMAANDGFDRLLLVAAPDVLCDLKDAFNEAARDRIDGECPQDMSRFSDEMVMRVLGDLACDATVDVDDDTPDRSASGRAFQGSVQ